MKSKSLVAAAIAITVVSTIAGSARAQRYMEKLDRGLVAVKSGTGYFLSWRLFGTDPQDTTFGFNVYRGTTKLNAAVITNSTNYQDTAGGTGTYTVKAVTNSVEGETSAPAIVIDNAYLNIPITPPPNGTNAGGQSYSYSANDASIGDLDGDGQYELVLKWDPSDARDNEMSGYTGTCILDAYKLDGTKMWRIDLGKNIRAGAHYTQFLVYDFDGDGMAEVAMKTAPGTKDGTGAFLKTGDAAGADNTASYISTSGATTGKITSGPEWYTVFAGKTGAELATINYQPGRGAVGVWGAIQGIASPAGDLGWGDDTVCNFVDRHLASVAYLDGERPSLIPCRGYYWRSALWALDWRDGKLTQRWLFDTAAVKGATGKDGKLLQSSQGYESQGSHSLRQGDVDGDGFDEIVYGSMNVDHDGQGLCSTGLRHGDALHMTDIDPNRPGLEIWMVDEQTSENGGISTHYEDAKDCSIIWEQKGTGDNGRGCTGPLIAGTTGWQMWSGAGGLYDASFKTVGSVPGSDNFTIWWGAEMNRFLENGTSITPYGTGGGTGLSASGCTSNNGSKSDPALTADIFGDWREEVVYRTTGNDALRIYTTTTPTTHRLYTLMHDPIYRMSVATENVAYNQPPEPGIYIGPNMTLPETKPNIKYYGAAPPTGGTPATGGAGGTTGSPGGTTGGVVGGSVTSTDTGGIGGTVTPDTSPSGGSTVTNTTAAETGGGGTTGNGNTSPSGGTTTTGETHAATQSGCGCRLAGADRSAAPWGVMLVLGAMLATRLRRRGERRRRS
jgi:rhamnogalacturonan endolyase